MGIIVAVGILISIGASGLGEKEPYVKGPDVQVSLARPNLQHYETQMGADLESADHLIACAYVLSGPSGEISNVVYVSFDGGETWTHTLTMENSVDPSCAIGIHGVAFVSSIHDVKQPDGSIPSFLNVRRSGDGGRTWQESSIQIDSSSFDRDYLTLDDTNGRFRHRVYVHGYLSKPKDSTGNPVPPRFVFCPSTDEGRTFDRVIPREASDFAKPWFFIANGVVSKDGVFSALFVELDKTKQNMSYKTDPSSAPKGVNAVLKIVRSLDGGETLDQPVKIADVYYDSRIPQLSMSSLAVDQSSGPFSGRMYASWPGAGPEPRTQVFVSYSSDRGKTWSKPRIVSDDAGVIPNGSNPNNFMPVLAVNKNGVVGISWYDRRDNPDDLGYWVRFSASLDGGASWLPSIRVSTHANVVNPAEHDTRFNGGDTAGLAADAKGVFHPLWIDNRTGVHQMWTTTVMVRQHVHN
jgi:hypothetical protein